MAELSAEALAVLETLRETFKDAGHGLWDEAGESMASPTRVEWIKSLRSKGLDSLDSHDLDLIMWRAMTTVGSEETFKYFLGPFIEAVIAEPSYGWTTQAHVLSGKLEYAGVGDWREAERRAVAAAMKLVAEVYMLINESEGAPDDDARRLRSWAMAELARS